MIPANADAVKARHMSGRVGKNIADDPHTRSGRIDIGVTHHELLEDIILDGTAQLSGGNTLLLGRNNVESHNGNNGPVHSHGNRHLIQRNLIKEDLHILYGINRYSSLAYIPSHPFMIAIVAAVSS